MRATVFHTPTATPLRHNHTNKTGAEDVGNSTSAAPVCTFRALTPETMRFIRRPLFVVFGLLAVGVALGRAGQNLFGDQAGVLADRRLDLGDHVGIGLEEGF